MRIFAHALRWAMLVALLGAANLFAVQNYTANSLATLITAINSANGDSDDSIITIDPGTLPISILAPNNGVNGLPIVNEAGFFMQIQNGTLVHPIGGAPLRFIEVAAGSTYISLNMNYSGGDPGPLEDGGAILNHGDNLSVIGNTFTDNSAVNGGAVAITAAGSASFFGNNFFSGNSALNDGGAIMSLGDISDMDSNTFRNNTAGNNGGALALTDDNVRGDNGFISILTNSLFIANSAILGGAIYSADLSGLDPSTLRIGIIRRTQFVANVATVGGNGGAIYLFAGTINLITQDTFTNNSGASGGAIYLIGALIGEISDSTFNLNAADAGSGGAILLSNLNAIQSSITRLDNSTFNQNTASANGGAVAFFINQPPPPLAADASKKKVSGNINQATNLTVSGNSAVLQGGGFYLIEAGNIFNLESDIVALNNAIIGGPDIFSPVGGFVTESFNLIGNNLDSQILPGLPNGNHSFVGTPSAPIDPLLAPLADNGGPTLTMLLLPGSLAIDQGANPLTLLFDQRGPGFPRTSGPQTDIGAIELQQACPICLICPDCPPRDDDDDDRGGDRHDHDGGDFAPLSPPFVPVLPPPPPPPPAVAVAVPVQPALAAPSVSVVEGGREGGPNTSSSLASNDPSSDEAGGCSSFAGVGASSNSLLLMFMSIIAGLRTFRSKRRA